ncbi:MAG: YraN family protein [Acutalibacteraceae bacterium]
MTTGELGEKLACVYLKRKGYTILCRNYHSRWGEIDIIARAGAYIVFAEVKTRAPDAIAPPEESVGTAKRRRILRTAQQYLSFFPQKLQPRFDVLALTMEGNGARVKHYENAFGAEDGYAPF